MQWQMLLIVQTGAAACTTCCISSKLVPKGFPQYFEWHTERVPESQVPIQAPYLSTWAHF